MLENFSTSSISSLLPAMEVTLPYVGTIDVAAYVLAFGVFVALSVFFKVVLVMVISHLKHLSTKTDTDFDDVMIDALAGVRPWVYTLASFFVAVQLLSLPELVMTGLTGLVLFAVVWQAIEVAAAFIDFGARTFLEKDEDGDGEVDPNAATASHMVTLLARIVLWAVGLLFVLSNLGIEVTSLIAGLGIGGIAIAFALQGILSDLFASFSIYFDKPFRIGDFVVLGADSGTVEKIGIKSTRLRTLQGEELVVSNAELTTARVQNFKKMEKRRVSGQFGITYDTDQKLVREIPKMVERIFEDIAKVDLDRVHFTTFGDSALIYDYVIYVDSPNYAAYLDIQQQFNLTLLERFAELGIEFAYPTQTLRFDSSDVLSIRSEK